MKFTQIIQDGKKIFDDPSLVSIEQYTNRMKICKSCDKFKYGWQCSVCKCIIPIKSRFSSMSCPLSLWTIE